jgi:lysophospholipase L1-like esterase
MVRLPKLLTRDPEGFDVLVVGDSLSVGEHASGRDRGCGARLLRALAGDPSGPSGCGIQAISGARVRDLLERRAPPARRLVVVELGTNDWLGYVPLGRWRQTPLVRFAADYARLLDRLTHAGALPVCLGVWGPADRGLEPGGRAEGDGRAEEGTGLAAYDAAIAAACHRRGGAFVALSPVYDTPGSRGPAGQRTPWGVSDATHPNDEGHRMIADLVLAACASLSSPGLAG